MTTLRQRIEEQLAAQRFIASQASREVSERAYIQNALDRIAELREEGYEDEAQRMEARLAAEGIDVAWEAIHRIACSAVPVTFGTLDDMQF